MKKLYPLLFLLLFSLPSLAQVTTDPALPQQDAPLTIFYNATEGTSSLAGAGKVYMHAGVILSGPDGTGWENVIGNWGQDDGIGQMQKVAGQENLWKIELSSPREYFNVAADQKIYRIGMVFRNADGSREGKNSSGGDIFVEVYEGFAVSITEPEEEHIFVDAGSSLQVAAASNQVADFTLYLNEVAVQTATDAQSISATISLSGGSRDYIWVKAQTASATETDTLTLIYRSPTQQASLPAGVEQGINVTGAQEVTLALLAPMKEVVYVVGDFTNWQIDPAYQMKQDGEIFWLSIGGLDPEQEYAYYYLVDEEIKVADPYSETVLDAQNDQYIDNERYPGLRSFPTEAETDRLTLFTINKAEYNWQIENFTPPAKEDLIIYELLVRDFTTEESFQGVIDKLDYLDSLNITAIQLMPIMEFNGNNSWGYNPTFQTAVDKWYGPKNKLKELIDKAHQRGMAVILDIALNHQDYPAPFLKMWWQGNTASPENPFFNVTPKHPFNVFTDMNHESPYTQEFVDRVNRYWMEEYKIDGYRFDLSKGFTQTDYGDNVGAWSSYDAGRVALLKRMADELWKVDPEAYIILEHFADNTEEKELANYGMMLWGNLNHNYAEALMGYQLDNTGSSFNWLSHKARGWNEPHVVGYIESHDEERLLFKAQEFGNSRGDYSVKELETALERAKMAAAFFIPVPGPKMLWQFQELGYDISINENGRTGKKPVKWEYFEDPDRQDLFRLISELNHLKTTHPVFDTENFELPGTGTIRTLQLNGDTMNVTIVGNFGLETEEATVTFQHSGSWYAYFWGNSLETAGTATLELEPGEFRLFTDQPIFYRGTVNPLALQDSWLSSQLKLYPNPTEGEFYLELPAQMNGQTRLRLMDTLGRTLMQQALPRGQQYKHSLSFKGLKPGCYIIEVTSGTKKGVKRILLQ